MARSFTTNQGLTNATGIVTAYPFSWGCWFKGAQQVATLMAFNATATLRYGLSSQSGGLLRLQMATGSQNAVAGVAYPANVWNHGLAIAAGATDRRLFLNGGNKATNTANSAFTAPNEFWIGQQRTALDPWTGTIAEAAIWNVALTDAEAAILATGISPRLVRPDRLLAYWPIVGQFSPEIPYKGALALTLTNAPPRADHVRVFNWH